MKLVELVDNFRNGGSYVEFCQSQKLSAEAEEILIYMKQSLDIDNDLAFFEIENIEGKIEYSLNEVNYFYLFEFSIFLEFIEEFSGKDKEPSTNNEVAQLLYNYAINDA